MTTVYASWTTRSARPRIVGADRAYGSTNAGLTWTKKADVSSRRRGLRVLPGPRRRPERSSRHRLPGAHGGKHDDVRNRQRVHRRVRRAEHGRRRHVHPHAADAAVHVRPGGERPEQPAAPVLGRLQHVVRRTTAPGSSTPTPATASDAPPSTPTSSRSRPEARRSTRIPTIPTRAATPPSARPSRPR